MIDVKSDVVETPQQVVSRIDRALAVSQALTAQGIPLSLFNVTGVGNTEPLRTGGTEWDQAANRWLFEALYCGNGTPQGFFMGWSMTSDPSNFSNTGWCQFLCLAFDRFTLRCFISD